MSLWYHFINEKRLPAARIAPSGGKSDECALKTLCWAHIR
jgi:hypothetical protein